MRDPITRKQFLKAAAAGTAGVAALGTSTALGARYQEYLPKGGSKVNVIVVVLDSLRKDPYELNNEYASAPPELKRRLETDLDALRQCSAEKCRTAEGGEG